MPLRGVDHFGMELHAVEPARRVGHGRDGAGVGACPARRNPSGTPAPCPDGSSRSAGGPASPAKSGVGASSRSSVARPYSPLSPFSHRAAQQVRHQLLAVADAEHGRPRRENAGIHRGAARVVDAVGPPEMMMPFRREQFGRRSLAGADLRVDAEIADLARDQVAVLAARVEDGDLRFGCVLGTSIASRLNLAWTSRCAVRSASWRCRAAPWPWAWTRWPCTTSGSVSMRNAVGVVHAEGVSVHLALQLRPAPSRGSRRTRLR